MISNIVFLLLGVVFSFFLAVIISALQFKHSHANFRLTRVVEATRKLRAEYIERLKDMGPVQSNYRYSFGVVINHLISTYGVQQPTGALARSDKHPILVNSEGDTWGFYIDYVRPVINDLNSHGTFTPIFIRQDFKKLKTLLELCDIIEKVVGNVDAIKFLQDNKKPVLSFDNAMEINESDDPKILPYVHNLKEGLKLLNVKWQLWVELTSD